MSQGPDAKKPKRSAATIPQGPQSLGAAIPATVVKDVVDIAVQKQPVISSAAQQETDAQKKRDEEAERLAKIRGKIDEDRLKSADEKEAARQLLEAKERHRAQAGEEERLRMQAERQAPANATALGAEAVGIAQKIQPDVSARAEAANKARADQIAADETLARQHLQEEKEHRAKVEAEKAAKAAKLAETKVPYSRRKKPEAVAPVVAPVTPIAVTQKEVEVIVVEKPTEIPVAVQKEEPAPVVTPAPVPVVVAPQPASTPVVEAPTKAVTEVPKPEETKGPLTRAQKKAQEQVKEQAAQTVPQQNEQERQRKQLSAETARREISQRNVRDKWLKRAMLPVYITLMSFALWGAGFSVGLSIAAALLLGIGMYFIADNRNNGITNLYRRIRYTDKQNYDHQLEQELKLNVGLERQFNTQTQQSLLTKLDVLAAHAPNPTFDAHGKFIKYPTCTKLTVVQYENEKLNKRASKDDAARAKWDEKFANKDDNAIYVKIGSKVK